MNVKKTERDGIVRAYPENGKPIAWSASSGVELIEKDGLYFKDLEKTGELLPYEDWRLPVEERAADLASRLTTEEIAGLMLYSPHQAVPPMAFGRSAVHITAKSTRKQMSLRIRLPTSRRNS